jgi:glycosyltransferase involved in cell wall biosynthesis
MRILIDLQGAQTGSRFRGIGRSSISLAKAIINNRGNHEILLLLNGLFEDTIEPIKHEFSLLIPSENIVVFRVPSPAKGLSAENAWRMEAAEVIREWTVHVLAPEVVLITSLFEGAGDDSVTSIGRLSEQVTTTAVLLHDLIPLLYPEEHLADPAANRWYHSKIDSLHKADLLLAVSESSRREAIGALGFDPARVVTIHSAADERFMRSEPPPGATKSVLEKFGICRPFIMHVSKIEPRKNFDGLIRAFGLVSQSVREKYQVAVVGDGGPNEQAALRRTIEEAGLAPGDVVLTGHVSDHELIALYSSCDLFVFPSFHEGFGLPVLEAMSCGAAVIGSNTTSIPEVIGREDALFDPTSDQSMAEAIERALDCAGFRGSLQAHARDWSERFSWDRTAELALRAMERAQTARSPIIATVDVTLLLERIAAISADVSPQQKDLVSVADCIAQNERNVLQRRPTERNPAAYEKQIPDEAKSDEDRRPVPTVDQNEDYNVTFVRELYRLFHNREPDADGFSGHVAALRSGIAPHRLVHDFLHSKEFAARMRSYAGTARATPRGEKSAEERARPSEIEIIRRKMWLGNETPRLLILKLDHMGDFIMTLDAFRVLRATWPRADMTVICGPWNKALAQRSGLFDHVISFNFYPDTSEAYDKEAVMARGIEKYRGLDLGAFDLAIDFRYFDDNRMLLSYTDAEYRAGYAAAAVQLDLALPVSSEPEMVVHNGARAMALASAVAWTFGTPAGGARDNILGGRPPVRHFKKAIVVGIAPGTGNPIKSWGRVRFAELARLLRDRGDYRFVLIGGDRDRADAQFIAESLPRSAVVDLTGEVPMDELPPIIGGLDVLIGNDTGTSHMAAMMGVPTVCIYSGQTFVESWAPIGPHVVTLRRTVSCSPCNLGDIAACPWNHHCMDIPPARVAAEAIGLLEETRLHLERKQPTKFGGQHRRLLEYLRNGLGSSRSSPRVLSMVGDAPSVDG